MTMFGIESNYLFAVTVLSMIVTFVLFARCTYYSITKGKWNINAFSRYLLAWIFFIGVGFILAKTTTQKIANDYMQVSFIAGFLGMFIGGICCAKPQPK